MYTKFTNTNNVTRPAFLYVCIYMRAFVCSNVVLLRSVWNNKSRIKKENNQAKMKLRTATQQE